MSKKITKAADRVEKWLSLQIDLRDDDMKLLSTFWWDELREKEIDLKKLSALEFLNILIKKKITSPESILRARRKLQEEKEHLRGKTYIHKKTISEPEVRQEIRDFNSLKKV